AAILGRKTYEDGLKMGGSFGGSMAFYVLSRTLPPGKREGVEFTNELPKKLVERLRQQKGKHIWMMGGGEVIRDFLKEDLIDEFYLGVIPVLIGDGIPLFRASFPQREFR